MALSSWFCATHSKSLFVKIVHPGGRVELHDRPLLAAELMLQNPRCCVTFPDVFRHPSAVVPPDSVLLLGHKYYIVPIGTLRKLQRGLPLRIPSPLRESPHKEEQSDELSSPCCLFEVGGRRPEDGEADQAGGGTLREGDWCFMCLLPAPKKKAREDGDGSCGETAELMNERRSRGQPLTAPRRTSTDQWRPSLESINEEKPC